MTAVHWLWAIVIVALASARLVRLVTKDTIFDELREWFDIKVLGGTEQQDYDRASWWRRKLADLAQCPYCVSAYTTAALLVLAFGLTHGMFEVPPGNWIHWPIIWLATWQAALIALAGSEGHEK